MAVRYCHFDRETEKLKERENDQAGTQASCMYTLNYNFSREIAQFLPNIFQNDSRDMT